MRSFIPIACLAALIIAVPAHALCFYNKADFDAGKARSYTTIAQEFRDSRWVVRARVLSAKYRYAPEGSWTLYTVRVLRRYKGAAGQTLRVFTTRDSGGFYLDSGTGPDLTHDYLLFLKPPTQDLPRGIRNVVQVNFSCGQSRLTRDLSASDRRLLDRLAAGKTR